MNPKKPRRNCKFCGIEVKRPQNVYCSVSCQKKFEGKEYVSKWLSGEISGDAGGSLSKNIRNYLIETRGEKCEMCGWDQRHPNTGEVPIEVHHINGNGNDHSPHNLILLCPNCHALTPTYRGRNRGNGRKNRPA